MKAQVGNWLVVHGRNLADPTREGIVVEVPHTDGSPPYVVRWLDDERVTMVFPGPDATLLPGAPPHRRELPFAQSRPAAGAGSSAQGS